MSRQDHERGRLERATAPNRIERILEVVATSSDHGAGPPQCVHRGHSTGHGLLMLAPLQVQVRRRQGNHGDTDGSYELGDFALAVRWAHAKADAVTGGHRVREARRRDQLRQFGQPVELQVERLVGV